MAGFLFVFQFCLFVYLFVFYCLDLSKGGGSLYRLKFHEGAHYLPGKSLN